MTINISYTKVEYSMYHIDDSDPKIAYRVYKTMCIYDGRVTNARIAREIPKGAVVERVEKVHKRFYVVGKNLISWLSDNGTVPGKE